MGAYLYEVRGPNRYERMTSFSAAKKAAAALAREGHTAHVVRYLLDQDGRPGWHCRVHTADAKRRARHLTRLTPA